MGVFQSGKPNGETMLKNISKLECKVNDKEFVFLCDNDSPTTCVKEALLQFIKFVGNIEDQALAKQAENAPTECKAFPCETCECEEIQPE